MNEQLLNTDLALRLSFGLQTERLADRILLWSSLFRIRLNTKKAITIEGLNIER